LQKLKEPEAKVRCCVMFTTDQVIRSCK